MLTNLDRIDWKQLGAEQVPQLIRAIHEHDAKGEIYSNAFAELSELLYPQGIADHEDWGGPTRMMQNDLPHQVTPVLIEILQETKSTNKIYHLIDLLADLCIYEYYHQWVGAMEQSKYLSWARSLRDKVRLGLPLYQHYLESNDEYLKQSTQWLMKWLEYNIE